jgi:L-rhamnose mutarotase
MTEDISKKVEQLKNSFTVEGVPLIPCRFSKEELEEMKKNSTCHSSHWMNINKVWTDEQIGEQINTMMASKTFGDTVLDDRIEDLMKSLPLENLSVEKETFKINLYKMVGWDVLTPLNPNFWARFGSAPFFISEKDNNKKLLTFRKLYGACGMNEIFGSKFEDNYRLVYKINNAIENFINLWEEKNNIKKIKTKSFFSPFNSLEEIEENVVVKHIGEEAIKFYHDKTKIFEERVKVFTRHGVRKDFIFHPTDRNINKIFKLYSEDEIDRNSIIECEQIISWWIEMQAYKKSKLDWENPYHPKLKQSNRNYKPSDDACERLYKYYMEKLFLDEVGSFIFDW